MDIQEEAVCLYKSDERSSVVTSLACGCCEVLCEVTAFVWIKQLCCVPTSLCSD